MQGRPNTQKGREPVILENKIAVVTGGVSGIGQATAMALAHESVRAVALVDQGEQTDQLAESMNKEIGRDVMVPFRGDVVDSDFRSMSVDTPQDLERVARFLAGAPGAAAS